MLNSINFSDPEFLSQIRALGYPSMLVIMILEGPIMTMAGAFAASLGFFNILTVFALSMLGDILGDLILYLIGFFGGNKALSKAEKLLQIRPAIIEKLEKLFSAHGKKTIFAVKSTTGLCWIAFMAAGTFRMKFKDFLIGSFLGGIVWSGFLVSMGYFFGYAFEKISIYIKYAGIVTALGAILFYLAITRYKRIQAKKIMETKSAKAQI